MDVEFVIILGSFAVLLTSLAFFVRYDRKRNEEAYERAVEDSIVIENVKGDWPFPTGERPTEKKQPAKAKAVKKEVKKTNRKTK